jgi:excisionase family DNA binding protein
MCETTSMRSNEGMPPLLMSIEDSAKTLSISKHTVIKWVKTGVIPSVNVGSRRLISSDDLQRIATEGLVLTRR